MKSKGVTFNETPRVEEYGTVVVFQDLYGNKWDLLHLNKSDEQKWRTELMYKTDKQN